MRVLVCGDRDYTNENRIRHRLGEFYADSSITIIHGGRRGADMLGGKVADDFGYDVKVYPADEYGRAIRNAKMLADSNPDLVLAFHDNICGSKGTWNMINLAKDAGIPVLVVAEYP